MGEVITVDFKSRRYKSDLDQYVCEFIDTLQDSWLADDDIDVVLDAIEDYEVYKTLDPNMQHFVDVWFHGIKVLQE